MRFDSSRKLEASSADEQEVRVNVKRKVALPHIGIGGEIPKPPIFAKIEGEL